MPKSIEADSITFTSHDGRCTLRLEAGEHHVGIVLHVIGRGTRYVRASGDGFQVGPDEPPEAASLGAPADHLAGAGNMIGETPES